MPLFRIRYNRVLKTKDSHELTRKMAEPSLQGHYITTLHLQMLYTNWEQTQTWPSLINKKVTIRVLEKYGVC